MKNFLNTLAAVAIIWIALQFFGPDLMRVEWINRLRPVSTDRAQPVGLTSPSSGTAQIPSSGPATSATNPAATSPLDAAAAVPTANPDTPAQPVSRPEVLNAVVTITGNEGAGTGFLCRFRGRVYVATNQHVLGVGNPLTIRTSTGALIGVRQILAATDADIALLEPAAIPAGGSVLAVASLPDPAIHQEDPTLVPGNSKGDGVITQTKGKLLAIGPQRIEVDNPVYPGNSGSPILDLPTNRVIGVLTEAELVTLSEFEKASFRSKDSAIKTTVRYFGHRLDSVQSWEGLNWAVYQETEALLRQSRAELRGIIGYLTDSSTSYKNIRELHDTINHAEGIYGAAHVSTADKMEAYDRFFQDLERFARRANARLANRKIYFQQKEKVETVELLSNAILAASKIARRDSSLAEKVFKHDAER